MNDNSLYDKVDGTPKGDGTQKRAHTYMGRQLAQVGRRSTQVERNGVLKVRTLGN